MKALVSIVMPVYNAEKYLADAVGSVLNQKYKNFELICVDDGSTDSSLELIEKFSQKDSRVKCIKQKNLYAGVARNNGMKVATGKYIMFLDSDDIFEKDMLAVLVKKAEKTATDIIYFGFYDFKNDLRHRSLMGIPFRRRQVCSPREHSDNLFQIAQGIPWNKFFNREFVMQTGLQFQNLQSNNDIFFARMIPLEAERILFLNKRFVNYRIDNASSLQGSYKNKSGNFSKALIAMFDVMNERNHYNIYRTSFEKYALDTCLTSLIRCQDKETLKLVSNFVRDSLVHLNLVGDCQSVHSHLGAKIFEKIIVGDDEAVGFEILTYLRSNYVPKNAVECRVGRKLLRMARVKYYD